MSEISNKLILSKLTEVLQLQPDADISKFNDDAALTIIFAQYQDKIQFSDAALDRMTAEIEELKIAQVQLRNQLKYVRFKQSSLNSQKGSHQYSDISKLKQKNQNLEQILRTLQQQMQNIKKLNEDYQKKILVLVQQVGQKDKQIQDSRIQLQSEKEKEKQYLAVQKSLREEIERISVQNEQDIQQYKTVFLQNLTKTLMAKSQQESQQHRKLALTLQQKLTQQQKILKQVVTRVSQFFHLKQPNEDQINTWLAQMQQKFDSYNREITKTTNKSLKDSKNPIKQLAQNQKKKIMSRDLILAKYIN